MPPSTANTPPPASSIAPGRAGSLLRPRGQADSGRVGMVELFFDLVFVFAITQLSHTLLGHLGAGTAAQVGLLLLAVWWAWIHTCWMTNWLDPERAPVRNALFALMLAGLVMSAAIPEAFGGHGGEAARDKGPAFALAYVALQLGRTGFMLWALRGEATSRVRNYQRIGAWALLGAAGWLAGAASEGPARAAWWAAALAVELLGPAMYFRVPGLGASTLADWDVDGHHMAERCALFIIIALGESLLVTGATFAAQVWQGEAIAAFLSAVAGTVAMWWLYFDRGAEAATHRIAHAAQPGRDARTAYTYLHVLIVAGILLGAVGDELVLAHPGHAEMAGIAVILGGPVLYLIGTAWFKWVTRAHPRPPLSHLVGLVLMAGLAAPGFAGVLNPLALNIACVIVLVIVAVWEHLSLRSGDGEGEGAGEGENAGH